MSASRIKTAQICSWDYWAKYILKIPDLANDGASRGTITHEILELLSKPKHRKIYDEIIQNNYVYHIKSIEKIIKHHAEKLKINDFENLNMINDMILVGLKNDFFGINEFGTPDEVVSEYAFDYEVRDGKKKYSINGFIDRAFIYHKPKIILIRDYKTSKQKFTGHDIEDNLQDNMYKLAERKKYPGYKYLMEFEFLRFPKKPLIRTRENSEQEFEGIEHYLTFLQQILDSYDIEWAKSSCARAKGLPKDGSFGGTLKCGKPFKKDGSKAYECPMKHPFNYYQLIDTKGKVIKTVREENISDLAPKEGERIIAREYKGCFAFYPENYE